MDFQCAIVGPTGLSVLFINQCWRVLDIQVQCTFRKQHFQYKSRFFLKRGFFLSFWLSCSRSFSIDFCPGASITQSTPDSGYLWSDVDPDIPHVQCGDGESGAEEQSLCRVASDNCLIASRCPLIAPEMSRCHPQRRNKMFPPNNKY